VYRQKSYAQKSFSQEMAMSAPSLNPLSFSRSDAVNQLSLREQLVQDAKRSLQTVDAVQEANIAKLRAENKLIAVVPGVDYIADKAIREEVAAIIKSAPFLGPQIKVTGKEPHFTESQKAVASLVQELDDAKKAAITDFCKNVALEATTAVEKTAEPQVTLTPQAILNAKTVIGQVIFLLDQGTERTEEVAKAILERQSDEKIAEDVKLASMKSAIQEQFASAMEAKRDAIKLAKEDEVKFGFIQEDAFLSAQLPKEIADLLITSKGFFNVAISDTVTSALLPETAKQKPYQKEIERVLDLCKNNPTMRQAINAAVAPNSPAARAVVSATLGLPATMEVTDVHAKKALLAAQLTKIHAEDGFEAAVADQIKTIRPDRFAHDVAALFNAGKLVRTLQGQEQEFSIDLDSLSNDLDTPFETNRTGAFTKLGGWIAHAPRVWEMPSIKSACVAMGIPEENHKKAVEDAILRIADADKKPKKFTITARTLIEELSTEFKEESQNGVCTLGALGYSSRGNNLLLKAWEQTIADLSNQHAEMTMRSRILRSVESTLRNKFTAGLEKNSLLQPAFDTFLGKLHGDLKLISDDETYTLEGISTPEQFRKLVNSHVASSLDATALHAPAAAAPGIEAVKEKVSAFVDSKAFLQRMLQRFGTENTKLESPDTEWEKLASTPWEAKVENNPFTLLSKYFGDAVENVASFTVADARTLGIRLLRFIGQNQEKSSTTRYGLAYGEHTFALSVDSAKFAAGLSPESAPKFDAPLPKESRQKIADWVKKQFVAEGFESAFDVSELMENPDLTLKQFRDAILLDAKNSAGILEFKYGQYVEVKTADAKQKSKKIERMLDTFIMTKALPEEIQKELAANTVRFAETTWSKNKALCFYQDPMGKGLRLGVVSDKGTVRPLNEEEWLNKSRPWSLFATKIEAPTAVSQ
jgi:hypothetical protein